MPARGSPRKAGNWLMSVPEMKARSPLPRITSTRSASSSSTRSQISTSRWYISQVMALRWSGRLTVRYATPRSTANRMCVPSIDDYLLGRSDVRDAGPESGMLSLSATRPRGIPLGRVRGAALLRGSTVLLLRPVGRRGRGGRHDLAEQLTGDVPDRHPPLVALAVDVLLHARAFALPCEPPQAQNQPPLLGTDLHHLRIDRLTDLENVGD